MCNVVDVDIMREDVDCEIEVVVVESGNTRVRSKPDVECGVMLRF